MNSEDMVKEFHKKYGHLVASKPTTNIPHAVKTLRLRLIREEFIEVREALLSDDLVEIADGIADLMYVLIGTAISYGIPITRVFAEVHQSNMTKTNVKATNGSKYGTKTPKGPEYLPPDISGILTEPKTMTVLERRNDSY